jgi:two-component system, LytTR family, sensor kinase
MKYFLLIVLLFFSGQIVAQKSYDQIIAELKKHPQQDTTRAELLIDACVSATFSADSNLLKMANEANAISNKLGYQLGIIRSLNCIGNYYFNRSINDQAISYYLKALGLSEKLKDKRNIVICKSNLANVFAHDNNHPKAIELLSQAEALLMQSGDTLSQNRAAILTNLAFSYAALKQHNKSIGIYQKVLGICQAKNIGFGIALTFNNLGKEYLALNDFKKALSFFENAKIEIEKNHVDFIKGKNLKDLAVCYEALGNSTKSLSYAIEAQKISKQNQDNEGLRDSYLQLQELYAKSGNYREAYHSLNAFVGLKDSLFSIETKKTINELNAKYETEKKDKEIKTLAQQKQIATLESERKNVWIYVILGTFLALATIAYFLFLGFKSKKETELLTSQLQEAERRALVERRATESELKALKSQMNPHFMFNALNSIQEEFMYGNKQIANAQMGNFTALTRQVLMLSGKAKITLATEINILTKYLELERMRFSDDFSYRIDVADDRLDQDYHQVPPMLIQPYVENSIRHGLLHKKGAKNLMVGFKLDEIEKFIICTVEDDGVGREASAQINARRPDHESFSTKATEERLKLLGNLSDDDAVVYDDLKNANHEASGTRVTIRIPL